MKSKDNCNRKVVKLYGYQYSLMVLPVYSLSRHRYGFKHGPLDGLSRIVFDWGKGLSHPQANVAMAVLSGSGQFIQRILYKENEYIIHSMKKCRSGKLAAYVKKAGSISQLGNALIKEFWRQ